MSLIWFNDSAHNWKFTSEDLLTTFNYQHKYDGEEPWINRKKLRDFFGPDTAGPGYNYFNKRVPLGKLKKKLARIFNNGQQNREHNPKAARVSTTISRGIRQTIIPKAPIKERKLAIFPFSRRRQC